MPILLVPKASSYIVRLCCASGLELWCGVEPVKGCNRIMADSGSMQLSHCFNLVQSEV
jgi:hypothetical protein